MRRTSSYFGKHTALTPALALAALACAPEPASDDICDLAAEHREQCTGRYITAPVCDEEAQEQARALLEMSCDEIEVAREAEGKADGMFCDWFGLGCTSDEDIFRGPSCSSDSDCAAGSHCAEGSCFEGVGSSEFSGVFDRETDSREVTGNSVQLLADNDDVGDLRSQLAGQAQESIHLSALFFSSFGARRELVEAAERGVEVRVIVDAVSQEHMSSGYDTLDELVDAGVDVLVFNPLLDWARTRLGISGLGVNNRLHEKVFIVDGEHAIIGGRNTGGSYFRSGSGLFDVDVYVRGPGVADIQEIFARVWDRTAAHERDAGCPMADGHGFYCQSEGDELQSDPAYFPSLQAHGNARTRALYSEPWTQDTADGYTTYLSMIRGARDSITLTAAYFIPPRRLLDHLRDAAERGVEVRILKNSMDSTFYDFMYYASLNFYRELIGAGVEIREYQGGSMMHAKAMVVDGEAAVVGSFNLSPRSAQSNSEALLYVRNSPAVTQLQSRLEAELDRAELATADLSLRDRIIARAHRSVEWLF